MHDCLNGGASKRVHGDPQTGNLAVGLQQLHGNTHVVVSEAKDSLVVGSPLDNQILYFWVDRSEGVKADG
ncbi:hypothetical protein D9M70_558000 [compost metagenome]